MHTWENVACQWLRSELERSNFKTASILTILNFHGLLHEERSGISRGIVVFREADWPSTLQESLIGIGTRGGLTEELDSVVEGFLVDVLACQAIVEVSSGKVELFGNSICGSHFATEFLSGGEALIGERIVFVVPRDVELDVIIVKSLICYSCIFEGL